MKGARLIVCGPDEIELLVTRPQTAEHGTAFAPSTFRKIYRAWYTAYCPSASWLSCLLWPTLFSRDDLRVYKSRSSVGQGTEVKQHWCLPNAWPSWQIATATCLFLQMTISHTFHVISEPHKLTPWNGCFACAGHRETVDNGVKSLLKNRFCRHSSYP